MELRDMRLTRDSSLRFRVLRDLGILVRRYTTLLLLVAIGGCSFSIPPDAFDDLDFRMFPDPEPVETGYDFSSLAQAEHYLSTLTAVDSIEGIWRFGGGDPPQHLLYEVAIIGNDDLEAHDYEFLGVVINSSNETFGSGDLKFAFNSTTADTEYKGVYYFSDASDREASFVMTAPDLIVVPVFLGQEWQDVHINRVSASEVAEEGEP